MTSDVKLLPLPEHMKAWANSLADDAQAYARANMEPLLAENERLRGEFEFQAALTKDLLPYQERAVKAEAENERLRAEAAKRDGIDPWAVLLRAQNAEARAERLAEALRSLLESVDDLTSYTTEDDEIGYRPCCNVLSYKEHADDCAITQARAVLNQENNDD